MSSSNKNDRPDPANLQVICLGMCRTGTMSLKEALNMLGFGPCFHGTTMIYSETRDMSPWSKIGDGNGTPADFDDILRGFHSALDIPVAMYGAELHAAYPNAKFILTVRDPVKWEKSMRATVFPWFDSIRENPKSEKAADFSRWERKYFEEYFEGFIRTDPQKAFFIHNNKVKSAIPPQQLLIYEVGEGWERLADFLNAPKPEAPFPHINSTAEFEQTVLRNSLI